MTEHGAKHIARLEKRAIALEARMLASPNQADFDSELAELKSIKWVLNELITERQRADGLAERVRELESENWDCKSFDLYPDGTMRPAHGYGKWAKADDFQRVMNRAETAERELAAAKKLIEELQADKG